MENVIFDITKEKTSLKGFWQDNQGKIYIDNIKLFKPKNAIAFEIKFIELIEKGEKAIFTIGKNEAFILYANGEKVTLKHKIQWNETRLKASYIKALLAIHGGLTIEKANGGYTLTIWKE